MDFSHSRATKKVFDQLMADFSFADDEVRFEGDYDAVPYAESGYRSAHFNIVRCDGSFTKQRILRTNDKAETWAIGVISASGSIYLSYGKGFLTLATSENAWILDKTDASVPAEIHDLIDQSRQAKLRDFTFVSDPAPAGPRM